MDMKKVLCMLFVLLSLIAFSASAFAEVSGNTYAVERTDKSKLKITKGLNEKDTEVVQDTWTFNSDGTFNSNDFEGTWSQVKNKVTVDIAPSDIKAFLEAVFLSEFDLTTTVNVIKVKFNGKEKKDGSIKGTWKVKADVLTGEGSGKYNFSTKFTGNLTLSPSSGDYPNAKLLVSADSLESTIQAMAAKTVKAVDNLAVIDARGAGYDTSHIPGAINLKFGDYFTFGTGLLPVSELETLLGSAGLSRDMTFVIYDDTTASWGAAGRIFWMLEYLGCTDVHILDGGWDKWAADGRPTEITVNTLPANTFVASVNSAVISTSSHISSRLNDSDFVVIDARTDEEYNGWQLYGEARGGHIPGAVQIPYAWFFDSDKTVKSYDDLKDMLESRGVTTDKEVTSNCTVGIRSAFVYFALRLMGYSNVSNYDASIVEWAANESLPMEKMANYQALVSPGWVKALIDYHAAGSTSEAPPEYPYGRDHKYIIFETQWGTLEYADAYKSGHVPGAIHSDSDIYENGYPRWFLLPDSEVQSAMGQMGITSDTTVVVYSNSPSFAARLWWILKYAGLDDIRLLNGGYEAWISAGYEGETTINVPVPATFTGTIHQEYRATTDYVFANYTDTEHVIIADNRSWEEHIGTTSGYGYLAAMGRIPNSIWVQDENEYYDDDNTLRSYNDVRQMWDSMGLTSNVTPGLFDKEVIFHCGGGYRSSLTFLHAYLMGLGNVRNYSDGWEGWSTTYTEDPSCTDSVTPGWCQDPSGRPVEVGIP